MDDDKFIYYAIIVLGILAYMFLSYLQDGIEIDDGAPFAGKYPSITGAFWFYFAAFACLLVFWPFVMAEHILETEQAKGGNVENYGMWHVAVHVPRIMFGFLANLNLLYAGIAYCQGKGFDARRSVRQVGIATVAMLFWVLLWELLGHTQNLFWTSLLIAPEVEIAGVAMVFLGWGFFVRWRGFSTLYLAVAIAYALLQLPAFLYLELDEYLEPKFLKNLEIAFPLLAACQILLAYGFLSLLRRSTAKGVDIDTPRFWPSGPRVDADWVFGGVWGGRTVDIVFGALVAVAMQPIGERFGPLLWGLIFHST